MFIYSWLAKRVVSWSSLDWDRGRWIQIDLVLGTLFDVMIHAMNSALLIPQVSSVETIFICVGFDAVLLAVVLFNPKLAWSNPAHVPTWVQKRVRTLSADERQEIKTIENIGSKLERKFSAKLNVKSS